MNPIEDVQISMTEIVNTVPPHPCASPHYSMTLSTVLFGYLLFSSSVGMAKIASALAIRQMAQVFGYDGI